MNRISVVVMITLLTYFAGGVFVGMKARAQCVDPPYNISAYRIYYHNAGLAANSIQDRDMDLVEFFDYLSTYSAFIAPKPSSNTAQGVVADIFVGCQVPLAPHGNVVEQYFFFVYSTIPEHVSVFAPRTFTDVMLEVAASYGRGSVVNCSFGPAPVPDGDPWNPSDTEAVEAVYASEVVLVGSPLTFCPKKQAESVYTRIGDKTLTTYIMTATGEIRDGRTGNKPANYAAVCVPSNWLSDTGYLIPPPSADEVCSESWANEWGSFSTPLLAGTVKHVADVVATRNVPQGEFVHKVLDYVLSSCDRVIPGDYQHLTGEALPSFGPWSPLYAYGMLSSWKALLYAYGFGKLEAKDSALHPEQTNPPTIFSDDFYLRGDLFIPTAQTFCVNYLATVAVDPSITSPEGPSSLGKFPALAEVRVAGSMDVETSRTNPLTGKKGVNSTIAVDNGGVCTVHDGGIVTIGPGQILMIDAGGTLTVETGGEIIIENGGSLCVFGALACSGKMTPQPGSTIAFGAGSAVYLGSDLIIPAGASLMTGSCTVTAASVDAIGTGNDADRVEIVCHGNISIGGSSNALAIFQGQSATAGSWVGLLIDHASTAGSSINFARISDAETGLAVLGGSGSLSLMNINIERCVAGFEIQDRDNLSFIGTTLAGEIKNCTYGMRIHCLISITGMSIHNNVTGIWVTGTDPITPTGVFPYVRASKIYANGRGVETADYLAYADLGRESDPGNNDFAGPYPYQPNTCHVWAIDPMYTLYAQYNWWGTKKVSLIAPKIKVWWDTFQQVCIFEPILEQAPGLASQDPRSQQPSPVASGTYLDQNHPNPFNPSTQIAFGLKEPGWVALTIYDVSGRVVRELANGEFEAGNHICTWDGKDSRGASVASGVYFYRLDTKDLTATKKMLMLR